MTVHDFLKLSNDQVINQPFVDNLRSHYSAELNNNKANQVFSSIPNGEFFDSDDIIRLLSHDEILNASRELDVDFVELQLIPLMDTGDNDFIVFDIDGGNWCKFNIVDSIKFKHKESLEGFFS